MSSTFWASSLAFVLEQSSKPSSHGLQLLVGALGTSANLTLYFQVRDPEN